MPRKKSIVVEIKTEKHTWSITLCGSNPVIRETIIDAIKYVAELNDLKILNAADPFVASERRKKSRNNLYSPRATPKGDEDAGQGALQNPAPERKGEIAA